MRNKHTSIKGRSLVLRVREALYLAKSALASPLPVQLTGAWMARWMSERCPKHSRYAYAVIDRQWRAAVGAVPLAELTVNHLRPLLHDLVRKGRAGATVWAYRTWIRTVLQDALSEGLISVNPADAFKRGEFPSRRPVKRRDHFTLTEVQRILDNTAGRDRVIVAASALLGWRLEELLGARVGDYVRTAQPLPMMRIASAWREREQLLGETKTNLVSDRPAIPALSSVLEDWIDREWRERYGRDPEPTDWLIPSDYAYRRVGKLHPLRSGSVRQILYRVLDRLGMPRRGMHSFCRTYVTALREAGAPRDLVKHLRHPAPGDTHDLYLVWTYPVLCEAVSRLQIAAPKTQQQLELFGGDPW